MDANMRRLFGTFPREIRKWRHTIKSEREFEREIKNGAKHISLYNKKMEVDKALIEIDANSVERGLEDSEVVVDRVKDEELGYIPVFSGRRGFHLYVLFDSFVPANEETGKYMLRSVQDYFSRGIESRDEQIMGQINHLIRIPNTKHEKSNCYCTFLPQNFVEWEATEIVEWAKEPHNPNYKFNNNSADIRDYVGVVKEISRGFNLRKPDLPQHSIPRDIEKMLEGLIRPCLMGEIFGKPSHKIRTELVIELKLSGYDAESIVEILSRLGWPNFDRSLTEYHVKKILSANLKPMSKESLKRLGLNPKWNYPWRFEN